MTRQTNTSIDSRLPSPFTGFAIIGYGVGLACVASRIALEYAGQNSEMLEQAKIDLTVSAIGYSAVGIASTILGKYVSRRTR